MWSNSFRARRVLGVMWIVLAAALLLIATAAPSSAFDPIGATPAEPVAVGPQDAPSNTPHPAPKELS